MNPEISYIVSSFSRPHQLPACLWSIYAQTHSDFECLVTDNSMHHSTRAKHRASVNDMRDPRFRYLLTGNKIPVPDPYWSAELGMKAARGKWLCFPCDDTQYPFEWAQRMLATAAIQNLDLVLCHYNIAAPETCGAPHYFRMELGTLAFPGYKPSFLVKAAKFPHWLNKPTMNATSGVDRTTLQHMVRNPAIRWGVCQNLYYTHN